MHTVPCWSRQKKREDFYEQNAIQFIQGFEYLFMYLHFADQPKLLSS